MQHSCRRQKHSQQMEKEEANQARNERRKKNITKIKRNTHKKVLCRERAQQSKRERMIENRVHAKQSTRALYVYEEIHILLCCGWLIQVFYWYTKLNWFFFFQFFTFTFFESRRLQHTEYSSNCQFFLTVSSLFFWLLPFSFANDMKSGQFTQQHMIKRFCVKETGLKKETKETGKVKPKTT